MTLGRLEDCPFCGYSGGYPVAVRSKTVVGMRCSECEKYYDMSTRKRTRDKLSTEPDDND